MADIETTRPRARGPAGRAALLSGTAITSIQFRGIGAAAAKPAADDEDANKPAADDEDASTDDAAAKKAKDDKAKKAKKARRARADADDGDPDNDTDPDKDGDDDSDENGDDDDDRDEMQAGSAERTVRMHERGRIAAILESPAAAANLAFAVQLALTTDLPRSQAVNLLKSAPKATAPGGLGDRMASFGNLRPGAGVAPPPKGQAAIDAAWDARSIAAGIMPSRR